MGADRWHLAEFVGGPLDGREAWLPDPPPSAIVVPLLSSVQPARKPDTAPIFARVEYVRSPQAGPVRYELEADEAR